MATITRPIGQLRPRQVKHPHRQRRLERPLEISIALARSTKQFFECPLVNAPRDKD